MYVKNDIQQFLPEISSAITIDEALLLPAMSLAFIGDSVHSMFVRTCVTVGTDKQTGELHKQVTKEVCAVNQSILAEILMPNLTPIEADIFRRARNARIHTSAKHAGFSEYRRASGFEAVLGFLYLTGQTKRIIELLNITIDAKTSNN